MARRRWAGHGDLLNLRRAGLALTLASLVLAACGLVPTTAPSISREGTSLVITVPGYNVRPVHGFLCPSDPGLGPTVDSSAFEELRMSGCLDLGFSDEPGEAWRATVNLESLASAQLEAFASRSTYRLVLISGSAEPRSVFAADVPAVNLVP